MKLFEAIDRKRLALAGAAVLVVAGAAALVARTGGPGSETVYACQGRQMTAAEIARARGIDPLKMATLRTDRGLTPEEVCLITEKKLARAIFRSENPKPDRPGEWAEQRQMVMRDENGHIPADGVLRAMQRVQDMRAAQALRPDSPEQISPSSWSWQGPGNIGGRIRSIVIHPSNHDKMWIGSVAGGIWRTTNGGASWTAVPNFLPNAAISTLVLNPQSASTMYAGTGEGFFNSDAIRGNGVFKSTDGGVTWAQLAMTNNADFHFVNRLAISRNGAALLAVTRTGIFRSTNGGSSWSKRLAGEALDVDFHPTNTTTNSAPAIAGGRGKAWWSANGGSTWTQANGLPSSNARIEVAYAPSAPNIVYASVDNNNGQLYRSTDGGKNYARVNNTGFLNGQGWYDNALWVAPDNSSFVIVGGVDLYKSTNGGATLTKISAWQQAPNSAHADHHTIVAHPAYNGTTNKTVFFGNDGGIYRATNVTSVGNNPPLYTNGWKELNNRLGITQFYGAAVNTAGDLIGGTQDNGTLVRRAGTSTEQWTTTFGGDGGFSAADPTDDNYMYGEYIRLQIHRSTNRGVSSQYIDAGIGDAGSCALFIAPFILDPTNVNRMYAGGCRLWRSSNVKAATPTWSAIADSYLISATQVAVISAIAVAPSNADIVWLGYANGDIFKSTNATSATPTWIKVDQINVPNRYVTRFAVDPANPDRVYVTFGGFSAGNVYFTANGGASWFKRSGSSAGKLPEVPVRSIVIHPNDANVVYVGTEVGVFYSTDGGTAWNVPSTSSGPNAVSVDELFFKGTVLFAATHGRGIYRSATLPF